MTAGRSALYAGSVMHVRLRPRRHRLRYRLFSLLLDLDELADLDKRLRLFSLDRFNLFSFHQRDHGAGDGRPLKDQIAGMLAAAGVADAGGSIQLLTMPRLLGHAFNPLSVYFCHRSDGRLAAILYEVNNTFGERHSYLIPVGPDETAPFRQKTAKRFYVSPFMDMDLVYSFLVHPPDGTMRIAIQAGDRDGPVLSAVHAAEAKPLSDATLLGAFLAYPLLSLKVVLGIHFEALRLFVKGMRPRRRPAAPDHPVTMTHGAAAPLHRS